MNMNRICLSVLTISLACAAARAQDPAKTDGDKYRVILENEKVRVLDYTDKPGQKTNPHHHPDFVLYALEPFKRKLTFPDGKSVIKELKKGDVIYMKDQVHIGENVGTQDTHVLIVELKPPAAKPDSSK
jgi:quercetin dioxygenase-like cupin family protein